MQSRCSTFVFDLGISLLLCALLIRLRVRLVVWPTSSQVRHVFRFMPQGHRPPPHCSSGHGQIYLSFPVPGHRAPPHRSSGHGQNTLIFPVPGHRPPPHRSSGHWQTSLRFPVPGQYAAPDPGSVQSGFLQRKRALPDPQGQGSLDLFLYRLAHAPSLQRVGMRSCSQT